MHPNRLGNYNWHDANLISIAIDYEKAVIIVQLDDTSVQLVCNDFIGIQYLGQWDECIIAEIDILEHSEPLSKCKSIIARNNRLDFLGGGTKSFDAPWYDLRVTLIDGVLIDIVCGRIDLQLL